MESEMFFPCPKKSISIPLRAILSSLRRHEMSNIKYYVHRRNFRSVGHSEYGSI
jgi:hypothetical protein